MSSIRSVSILAILGACAAPFEQRAERWPSTPPNTFLAGTSRPVGYAPSTIVVGSLPPALIYEVIPVSPAPDAYWIPGSWDWNGYEWVWVAGHYEFAPVGYVWIGPFYQSYGSDCEYTPGYWEEAPAPRAPSNHGTLGPTGRPVLTPRADPPAPRPGRVARSRPTIPAVTPAQPALPAARPAPAREAPSIRDVEPAHQPVARPRSAIETPRARMPPPRIEPARVAPPPAQAVQRSRSLGPSALPPPRVAPPPSSFAQPQPRSPTFAPAPARAMPSAPGPRPALAPAPVQEAKPMPRPSYVAPKPAGAAKASKK
jgi:hypothetical protein